MINFNLLFIVEIKIQIYQYCIQPPLCNTFKDQQLVSEQVKLFSYSCKQI